METFGQKLRQAVELRGLRLKDVAEATRLDVEHIQALERDDFSSLPDEEIIRAGLQSFARLVDVDPDQVIADFHQERQRWLAATALVEAVAAPDARHAPRGIEPARSSVERLVAPEPSKPRAGRGIGIAIPVLAILALAVVAFILWSRPSTAPAPGPPPAVARDLTPVKGAAGETPETVDAPADTEVSPPDGAARPSDSEEPVPAIEQPIGASGLSIPEHGVGKSVVDRELVGETDQFAEGEQVWFWTRIEGGAAGEMISHVWIHEGEEALSVPVRLGGVRWRTQTYKILNPGSAGSWAVEARDTDGRVLARREFLCSPRH